MKSYDDLSNAEKDKVKTYLLYRNGLIKYSMTILSLAYIAVFIGFPLSSLPYLQLFVAGVYLMAIGLFLAIIVFYKIKKYEKYAHLAFGITDVMEDVFEIKKTDIKELKKTWKKVK